MPGRAAYGFSLRSLSPSDIRYTPAGEVVVTLPPLTVFSAEPVLEDAEVSVDARRWQRLSREPERAAVPDPVGSCTFLSDLTPEELDRALVAHRETAARYPRGGEGLDAFTTTDVPAEPEDGPGVAG